MSKEALKGKPLGSATGHFLTPEEHAAEVVEALPRFPSLVDLREAFKTQDDLLDAYVRGWLSPAAVETLESHAPALQCWLLARLLRLELARSA